MKRNKTKLGRHEYNYKKTHQLKWWCQEPPLGFLVTFKYYKIFGVEILNLDLLMNLILLNKLATYNLKCLIYITLHIIIL